MSATAILTDLLERLGHELDFDVARDVASTRGAIDIVWFNRSLPLAAIPTQPLDLGAAPVLPVVAFVARTAAMLEATELAGVVDRLEASAAPLRVIAVARDSRHAALAPALQSVEQLRKQDDDAAARCRIAAGLRARANASGGTIVMLQAELVEWARRLREVRPRSYSAESLFNRTGAID